MPEIVKPRMLEEYISCDCSEEGLLLRQYCDEDVDYDYPDFVYIAVMNQGYRFQGLRERLRLVWRVLRHGTAYSDQLVLNREGVERTKAFCEKALEQGVPGNYFQTVRPLEK